TKRVCRPDHSIIWIEILVTPFETIGGNKACHLCMIKDISEHKQLVSNLHDLTAHLQNVREDERTRIAREIHDVLGATLTVLKMDLDWLSKKVVENPMHERIISLHELAGEAIETARRVSLNLRPNVLDNLGLIGAIEWLVREFEQRLGINCLLQANIINHDRINKQYETSIFRIVQEIFTNITRHAEATEVVVKIEEIDQQLLIVISDNGIGITEQQLFNPKSFGIIGMYERTEQLGGKLRMQGEPSKGSMIELKIPLLQDHLVGEPIT
ncbi:MAG: histidine kinase, partial [Nitrosomonas sp.]|nr:histidine kinase [Nitrosomonas sp.]